MYLSDDTVSLKAKHLYIFETIYIVVQLYMYITTIYNFIAVSKIVFLVLALFAFENAIFFVS